MLKLGGDMFSKGQRLAQYKNSPLTLTSSQSTFQTPLLSTLFIYRLTSIRNGGSGFNPLYLFEELRLTGDGTTPLSIAVVAPVLLLHLHLMEVALFLHREKFHSFRIGGYYLREGLYKNSDHRIKVKFSLQIRVYLKG